MSSEPSLARSEPIWIRVLAGEEKSVVLQPLRTSLGEAGFALVQRKNGSGPGIVLFDHDSPELFEIVHAESHNGLERILAVATHRHLLRHGIAWALLSAGASDVLVWNGRDDQAGEIAARFRRWSSVDQLIHSEKVQERLVGQGAIWISILRQIVEAAAFTDAPVLIMGESGTGKELVARLIHDLDTRSDKASFVVLDCATVVPSLSGSEFFGHEKGAFTGAVTTRDGAFALADRGTLFLDEVGELSPQLQAELLRVIQEGMFKRIGSNTWRSTRFRLVCATNLNLPGEVEEGRFRRDLFHRMAGWVFHLPNLRERSEDIMLLVRHFLRLARPGTSTELDESVGELLSRRTYAGNIRELRQLVLRMCSRHDGGGPITVGDIPPSDRPAGEEMQGDWRSGEFERSIREALARGATLSDIKTAAVETAIRLAIAAEGGNLQRASRMLGVTDRALQHRFPARRTKVEKCSPKLRV
jgi:transcriptional regulator with GAF, ATPase, and Fis domain